jgi:hypothetical protein
MSVYCHWDGYLSNNGRILQEHYTDAATVKKLVSKGAISSLDITIGRKHSFDERGKGTTFYARDRGERLQVDKFDNRRHYMRNVDGQEYDYLFTKDGQWLVRCWCNDEWIDLDEMIEEDMKERASAYE